MEAGPLAQPGFRESVLEEMTPELEAYGSISQEQISRRGTAGGDRGENKGTGDGRRQSVGSYY